MLAKWDLIICQLIPLLWGYECQWLDWYSCSTLWLWLAVKGCESRQSEVTTGHCTVPRKSWRYVCFWRCLQSGFSGGSSGIQVQRLAKPKSKWSCNVDDGCEFLNTHNWHRCKASVTFRIEPLPAPLSLELLKQMWATSQPELVRSAHDCGIKHLRLYPSIPSLG